MKCIRLNELNASDLEVIALLAFNSNLTKFGVHCMAKLLRNGPLSSETTPVPPRQRLIRARNTKLFSFTFCFYKISESLRKREAVYSEWVLDVMGKRKWRLEIGFKEKNDEDWVSCYLQLKECDANDKDEDIGFQLYAINKHHDNMLLIP